MTVLPGGRKNVRASGVKSDVPVGTNASHKKTDTSFFPDSGFVVSAPLVDKVDGFLLQFL
jgi:hypothetical protein